MPTDSSRVSTKSKETPGHIFQPGITVASDTDVAERGFARRSIHDERKDAIVRRANVFSTVVRVCSVHARVASGNAACPAKETDFPRERNSDLRSALLRRTETTQTFH